MNRLFSWIGIFGALICTISMFAVPLGLIGSAAATAARAGSQNPTGGMSAMSSGAQSALQPWWYTDLQHFGPEVLIVSLLLIVGSVALRRSWGVLPAIAGGAILYVGMYVQASMTAMLWWIVAGFVLMVGAVAIPRRASICDDVS